MRGIEGLYSAEKKILHCKHCPNGFLFQLAVLIEIELSSTSIFSENFGEVEYQLWLPGGTGIQVKCPFDSNVAKYHDL